MVTTPHIVAPFFTESLAEIPSLEASLQKREDARVVLASTHWRWSEKEPFPPLSAILKAPLWAHEKYSAVRTRLLSAIPSPEVRMGGQYATVSQLMDRLLATGAWMLCDTLL